MSGWISLSAKKNNSKRKAQRGQHNVKKIKTPKTPLTEKQRKHKSRWEFVENGWEDIGEATSGSKDGPFIPNPKIFRVNDANDANDSDDSIGSVIDAVPESYSDRTHVSSSASHQRSVNPGSISLPLTPPSTTIESQSQTGNYSDSSLDLRISDSETDNEDSQLLLEDSDSYDSDATVPPDSQDF